MLVSFYQQPYLSKNPADYRTRIIISMVLCNMPFVDYQSPYEHTSSMSGVSLVIKFPGGGGRLRHRGVAMSV